jgi:two-component system chemotaxis response regulator CheY
MEATKILVIDDSKLIHKMFEVMLRPHNLVHAYDGQEGLHRLAENADVGLILLDVNMPRMNGLEFLGEVKGNADLAEIPVVVISTEGREEDTERAMEAGAAEYIKKPFQSESVLNVVQRLAAA